MSTFELVAATNAASRFVGPSGERLVTEAFAGLEMLRGDIASAAELARLCHIETHDAGGVIFNQGDASNDFYFILLGSVAVETHGRPGPVRTAGAHFGEMALIDVHATRSATIRAIQTTVTARISELDFAAVAAAHPDIWRSLAKEVARRLRQRLADVIPRNDKPVVFVGSSLEGLPIAECIRSGIAHAGARDVHIWTKGVFGASKTTIESLEAMARHADIGILVLSPDDKVRSRGKTQSAPRDNVIFELGLFMGALGRHRTFAVRPRATMKVLSDLLGVTLLLYEDGAGDDLATRLAPVCVDLDAAIAELGPK